MPKASKIIRQRKLFPPLRYQIGGWDQGKISTCAIEVKMAQGAMLDQRSHPKSVKGWEVDWSF